MILRYLPLFLLGGFVLEIASIIWVGQALGVLMTLVLLVGGGVIGLSLFRSAGTNMVAVMRSSIQAPGVQRQLAGTTLARVMAGILFLVPGFFSDILAILSLMPPVQSWISARIKVLDEGFGMSRSWPADRDVQSSGKMIEGEVVVVEETNLDTPSGEDRPRSS